MPRRSVAMLQKLGITYRFCRARAEECEAYARDLVDVTAKEQYLEMARHWTRLANSYEYNVTLERFLINTYKKGWPFQTEKLPEPPEYDEK
jgi:hypothetical protein